MTCNTPAPNHVRTATANHMQGGCRYIRRRPGEVEIWVPPGRRNRNNNGNTNNGNDNANNGANHNDDATANQS